MYDVSKAIADAINAAVSSASDAAGDRAVVVVPVVTVVANNQIKIDKEHEEERSA